MKLTGWYRKNQKPKRIGVYQVRFPCNKNGQDWFRLWDGKEWKFGSSRPVYAAEATESATTREQWRGLARKPK